jgi:SAM-dependent MidA family methyltransferase
MNLEMKHNDLTGAIRARIEQNPNQAIPFRDYMELVLYHPKWGYYTSAKPKIGKSGDFYTSANIGGLMGELLAEYVAGERSGKPELFTLVEWGGGSGMLAKQLLDALAAGYPSVYELLTYISIEASDYHRMQQMEQLAGHRGKLLFLTENEWLERAKPEPNIVLSNELHDAFPVHAAVYRQGKWYEIYVAWNERGRGLTEIERPFAADQKQLAAYINTELDGIQPEEGQRIEINLESVRWLERVTAAIEEGSIVTIDYGCEKEELYAPHRLAGTLMCYYRHQAHEDPYRHPGEQDMTAHVNFTALLRAGDQAGLHTRLMTQKQFLLECGILSRLSDVAGTDPFSPPARKNRAIRQLLLSDQMSELFKVMIAIKHSAKRKAD